MYSDTKLTVKDITGEKTMPNSTLRDPNPIKDVPDQDSATNVEHTHTNNSVLLVRAILGEI